MKVRVLLVASAALLLGASCKTLYVSNVNDQISFDLGHGIWDLLPQELPRSLLVLEITVWNMIQKYTSIAKGNIFTGNP